MHPTLNTNPTLAPDRPGYFPEGRGNEDTIVLIVWIYHLFLPKLGQAFGQALDIGEG